MLPGVAQIHVVANGHEDSSFVVAYAAPMGHFAGFTSLVHEPGLEKLRARHLEALLEVVERVKDRVTVRNVLDGPVGKHLMHAGGESVPLSHAPIGLFTVEIVYHEEA